MAKRINSRSKGKRGELEAKDALGELGIMARRRQQFCGEPGHGDIVVEGWPELAVECKLGSSHDVYKAMEQAQAACLANGLGVVVHRKDRGRWMLTLNLVDLWRLVDGLSRIRSTGTESWPQR
jgi:hypothetical protein